MPTQIFQLRTLTQALLVPQYICNEWPLGTWGQKALWRQALRRRALGRRSKVHSVAGTLGRRGTWRQHRQLTSLGSPLRWCSSTDITHKNGKDFNANPS